MTVATNDVIGKHYQGDLSREKCRLGQGRVGSGSGQNQRQWGSVREVSVMKIRTNLLRSQKGGTVVWTKELCIPELCT